MAVQETVVASLLNSARPGLEAGWEMRETGSGELSVRNLRLGKYVVLPVEAADLLPLLDSTRSLNEVAAALLEKTGRVRHHMILDTVVRMRAAGLLTPLEPEIDKFLAAQVPARSGAQKFLGLLRSLAGIKLFVPFRITPPGALLGPGNPATWIACVLVFLLYPLALIPYFKWGMSVRGAAAIFGQQPVANLLLTFLGLLCVASFKEVVQVFGLLFQGRTVSGFGIRVRMGLPHLAVNHIDDHMLDRRERRLYYAGNLAMLCLASLVLSSLHHLTDAPAFFYLGFGAHLAVLLDVSPLWASDFSNLLQEVLGSRRLRRSSNRYLLKKLWKNVVKRAHMGREEVTMMVFASLWILYLFVAAMVLGWLAPNTVDALSSALLSPRTPVVQTVLAIILTVYLWLALLFFAAAIVTAVLAALAQLASAGRGSSKPFEVQKAESLEVAALADELRAIAPFERMPRELVEETLANGRVEKYRSGATIIQQGEAGDTCYVVRSGTGSVVKEDASGARAEVAKVAPGELFGEVALLFDSPRTASVVAGSDVEVIAIDRETFGKLVEQGGYDSEQIMRQVRVHLFLKEIELLRGLSSSGMASLMKALELIRPKAGEDVVKAGDSGDTMYVIYEGSCEVVTADGQRVATLKDGDYFGEIALVTGATRSATVRCIEDSVLVELPARLYQDVIVREFATGVLLDQEVDARLETLSLT